MLIENRLTQLATRLKHSQPTPLRLSVWNGRNLNFSRDPKVTIVVPQKRALRSFLPPEPAAAHARLDLPARSRGGRCSRALVQKRERDLSLMVRISGNWESAKLEPRRKGGRTTAMEWWISAANADSSLFFTY